MNAMMVLRRSDQAITDAAHCLQEQRIGGVALDLAPQAVDLHVDRAFVHGAVAGQRAARHRLSPGERQKAKHVAFAVGEADHFLAVTQLAALQMVDVGSECDLLQHCNRGRGGALEDIADS